MKYLLHRFALFIVFCMHVTGSKSDEGWWQTPEVRACCSEADAVYADEWEYKDGKIYAEVNGGGPRNHSWAPIGRVYEIPLEKVLLKPGNPTGRGILFLRQGDLSVLCYLPGSGI